MTTLAPEQIAAIAAAHEAARRTRVPIDPPTRAHPAMTLADSYAIQAAWIDLQVGAGAVVRGHKVGLTSRAMQQAMRIDEPDFGALLDDMFIDSGATIRAADYLDPKLEVEFAFVLGSDLVGTDTAGPPGAAADRGRSDAGGRNAGGRDAGGRASGDPPDTGDRDAGGRDASGRDAGGRDVGGRASGDPPDAGGRDGSAGSPEDESATAGRDGGSPEGEAPHPQRPAVGDAGGSEAGGREVTAADVYAATERIVPALELIDARSHRVHPADGRTRTVRDTIADNAADAGIVVGERSMTVDRAAAGELRWAGAILSRNGVVEETGLGAGVLGDPVLGVVWLANRLRALGIVLAAGETILAGSFTRPVDCRAGDDFRADFGPLGTIDLHIT